MKKFGVWVLLLLIAVGVWKTVVSVICRPVTTMVQPISSYTLVIDAGHGGEDGGAVSISGISESHINLSIACKLEDILALYGVQAEMLRREDISLHSPEADTLRKKKVSDLHNRVSRVEEIPSALLVSIHQNSYPDSRYRGAQVFYGKVSGSEDLAKHVQMTLNETLGSYHTRTAKKIPESIYLMKKVTCPAILVECGFLTHPEEEALLRTDTYQQKIAACIANALLTAPMGDAI